MSTHDIHADQATADDFVAVAKILAEHRGRNNAISSQEIADRTGLDKSDSTPRTRGVIRQLQRQFDWPVAATSQGYFLISQEAEAKSYLDNLDGRITGIEKRKDAVISSIDRRGVAGGSDSVTEWIEDVREELEE